MIHLLPFFAHDNVIHRVTFDLYNNIVMFEIGEFGTSKSLLLNFYDVKSAAFTNDMPWGRSNVINESKIENDVLTIQLQSGDEIKIAGLSEVRLED
jgi:ABC-type phosphonate transport system ATPase subunit